MSTVRGMSEPTVTLHLTATDCDVIRDLLCSRGLTKIAAKFIAANEPSLRARYKRSRDPDTHRERWLISAPATAHEGDTVYVQRAGSGITERVLGREAPESPRGKKYKLFLPNRKRKHQPTTETHA